MMTSELVPAATPDVREVETRALAARAQAEIQARHIVALQRPRSVAAARQRVLDACRRTRFAEAALYRLPRAGKAIEGLSIRWAEEAARSWGHLEVRDEVIHEDDLRRVVRVSVVDLETNASYARDVMVARQVERKRAGKHDEIVGRRTNSSGEELLVIRPSEDELAIRQYALIAKAMRTCILRLIPADLQEEALDAIRATLEADAAQDPLAASKRLADAFAGVGVTAAQIEAHLGHPLGALSAREVADLRGLYQSIRDGETTWAEATGATAAPDATQGVRARIAAKLAPKAGGES